MTKTWHELIPYLAKLERLSDLASSERRTRLIESTVDEIIDDLGCLTQSGAQATALETAVAAGSARLVMALPVVQEEGLAGFDEQGWLRAARSATPDVLRGAHERGMVFDHHALSAILDACAGNEDLLTFATSEMSAWQAWYTGIIDIPARWFSLRDASVASAFLRAQVSHHPEFYASDYEKALAVQADLVALILWAAGAAPGPANPDVVKRITQRTVPSRHRAMQRYEAIQSLEGLHLYYGANRAEG